MGVCGFCCFLRFFLCEKGIILNKMIEGFVMCILFWVGVESGGVKDGGVKCGV